MGKYSNKISYGFLYTDLCANFPPPGQSAHLSLQPAVPKMPGKSFPIVCSSFVRSFVPGKTKKQHSNRMSEKALVVPADIQSLLKYWPEIQTIWKFSPKAKNAPLWPGATWLPSGWWWRNLKNNKSGQIGFWTGDGTISVRAESQQGKSQSTGDCYKVLNVFNINRIPVIGFLLEGKYPQVKPARRVKSNQTNEVWFTADWNQTSFKHNRYNSICFQKLMVINWRR